MWLVARRVLGYFAVLFDHGRISPATGYLSVAYLPSLPVVRFTNLLNCLVASGSNSSYQKGQVSLARWFHGVCTVAHQIH